MGRKQVNGKGILYVRGLPEAVKNSFKAKCALYGDTMEDVIEALLRAYIKHPEKFNVIKKRDRRNPWKYQMPLSM